MKGKDVCGSDRYIKQSSSSLLSWASPGGLFFLGHHVISQISSETTRFYFHTHNTIYLIHAQRHLHPHTYTHQTPPAALGRPVAYLVADTDNPLLLPHSPNLSKMLPGNLLLSLVMGLDSASAVLAEPIDTLGSSSGSRAGPGVGVGAEANAAAGKYHNHAGADAHKTHPIGAPEQYGSLLHIPYAHEIVGLLNKYLDLGLSAGASLVEEAPHELGAQGRVCVFCWCFEAAAGEYAGPGDGGKDLLAAKVKSDARIWFDHDDPMVNKVKSPEQ